MDIGIVIKKYRKEAGMTQEEMANRLGVTTPAVNKWENSNSKPDIELLAPIARLLDISLDTLLSFHEKLSDTEIEEIIRKMDRMFSEEGYEKTYEWALRLIKEYPNCNMLIWQTAVMLDARRITDKIGGMPDWTVWILCVIFTLIWARIAALFANKATPKTLNRVTGVILVILGLVVMGFNLLT